MYHDFVNLFCLTVPKNFVGAPLCFGNVLVPKNFWITNYLDFVEIFCITSPKIIVGEMFCVSKLLWYQTFLDNRGVTILSIFFVSQCQKFCGEPPNGSKKLGHPKILCIIGEFHDFPWKICSLTVPTSFAEEPLCVPENF